MTLRYSHRYRMILFQFMSVAVVFLVWPGLRVASAQEKPEDFKQLLPRGGIPAIDNPQYVSADQAKIDDESFVLGVVIEGQAVAYSLNLLNRHEVVNDTIGGTNFAAVW